LTNIIGQRREKCAPVGVWIGSVWGKLVHVGEVANRDIAAIGAIGDASSLPVLALIAEPDRTRSTPRKLAVNAMIKVIDHLRDKVVQMPEHGIASRYEFWKFERTVKEYHHWANELLSTEMKRREDSPGRPTKRLMRSLGRLSGSTDLS
jgi:hypothetical protein